MCALVLFHHPPLLSARVQGARRCWLLADANNCEPNERVGSWSWSLEKKEEMLDPGNKSSRRIGIFSFALPRKHKLVDILRPGRVRTKPAKVWHRSASPNLHGLARAAVLGFGQDEPAQRQEFEAAGQVSGRARLLPRHCTSIWVQSDENSSGLTFGVESCPARIYYDVTHAGTTTPAVRR